MSDTPNIDPASFRFYCDMTALSPAERTTHQEHITRLFSTLVRETRELADGFAYRFDGEHYPLLAAFIRDERRCCPFLTFRLEVAPEHGPIWLQLTGPDGVKPFLVEELGHYGRHIDLPKEDRCRVLCDPQPPALLHTVRCCGR